jgi:hypothetical protein
MKLQHFFAAIFTLSNLYRTVGYPFGAGSCVEGPAVLGSGMSPHVTEDYVGKLIDGNYTASLNETHFLLKAKAGNYFKGFLLRLSSKQGSVAGQMQILPDYETIAKLMESTGETIGVHATCAVDVAGVTHKDSYEKTEVGVQLNLQKGLKYHLMITVVKDTHTWFYTNKTISVLEGKQAPSPSPVAKVSRTTAAPTAIGTAAVTTASTSTKESSAVENTAASPTPSTTTTAPTSPSDKLRSTDQSSKITSGAPGVEGYTYALMLSYSMIFVACFLF